MIWLILCILAIIAALYLTMPLLPAKTQAQKIQISLFITLFIGANLGTYRLIGAPELSNISKPQTPPPPAILQAGQPQVTPEQITAMVEGLAARLADEPEDPAGWTQLIRSRIVLGDIPALIQDHRTMTDIYKNRPEILAKISQDSGFNTFAEQVVQQP